MHRTSTRLAVALVAVLALAGCDDSDPVVEGEPTGTAAETTEPDMTEPAGTGTGTAAADVTLATASSSFGTILVDGDGLTLYVFDNDSGGESTCEGGCAEAWPPVTGSAAAGEGVDANLIGTTERTDGSTQVTYNGMPLYYYAADSEPGDVNGQASGGVWWVVGADGEKVTAAAVPPDETYGLGAS